MTPKLPRSYFTGIITMAENYEHFRVLEIARRNAIQQRANLYVNISEADLRKAWKKVSK